MLKHARVFIFWLGAFTIAYLYQALEILYYARR